MQLRKTYKRPGGILAIALVAGLLAIPACEALKTPESPSSGIDLPRGSKVGTLPSAAPMQHSLVMPGTQVPTDVIYELTEPFWIFHDGNGKPQKRASAPFEYGYVDVPRSNGYAGRLSFDEHTKRLVKRDTMPQAEGAIRLYLDGEGQSQVKHRGGDHMNAHWEWDATLPQAKPGMVIAFWTFSGPAFRAPDGYQFEFDIEFLGGGEKGPRIEANFHDGKGPAINFGSIKGDWSGLRAHMSIEQNLDAGITRIMINDRELGTITRDEVEDAGRTWPDREMYGVTDMWLVSYSKDAPWLAKWAGKPDLDMKRQTLRWHGYDVAVLDAPADAGTPANAAPQNKTP